MSTENTTSDRGGSLKVGDVLQGRYELLEELGEGGFAVVYKAFDETIERYVAIKVLHTDQMASEGEPAKLVRSRFLREARLAAQIRHSSIIEIYDFGVLEELDQPYMIMEFLEGKDLDDEIEEKGALLPERLLPLFIDALEALGEAHEKGVVHKDLKPANLFLTNPGTNKETLKVVDFGIAHADHQAEERLTKTGAMTGTPHYLPPEYLEEQEVLTEMDVYQMGLILIEALSGRRVVTAETVFQAVLKHVNRDLSIPPVLLQGRLGSVIRRAIAYDPEMRYSTATEFAQALAKVDPADVVDFNDPKAVEGMESQSLAKLIETGVVEPLSEGEDSTFLDESAVAQTVISEKVHTSGEQAEIDNTHQEFGNTGSSTAVELQDGGAALEGEVASKMASTEEHAGSLSTEQVEAAFGSTWPLKVLAGMAVAVLLSLGALVALVVINGDDEEVADEEVALVDEDTPDDEEPSADDAVAQQEDDAEADDDATPQQQEEIVSISVDSVPSGATVERMDGSAVGSTPTEVKLERGAQKDLVLAYSGYESKEIVVDSSEAGTEGLTIELEEESAEAEPVVEEPADPTPSPTPEPVAQPAQEEPEEEEVEEEEAEEEEGWALPGEEEPEEEDDEAGGFELAQ